MQYNYDKNNYYIDKNEKLLNYEDIIENNYIKDWLNTIFTDKEQQKTLISILCSENPIGVPYQILNSKEEIYLSPQLITHINFSSGMSAGNTLEEALVQGLSEIFEHYVTMNIFKDAYNSYFELDVDILDISLQNIIHKIKSTGNDIRLFDLSFNCNLPVVCGILINKFNHTFHLNIASAPVFNIAIERVLTELYQNRPSFLTITRDIQKPSRNNDWFINYNNSFSSVQNSFIIQENILLKSNKINNYNTNVFLKNNSYDNNTLLNHYLELCNKLGLNIIYRNNSLLNNMYAIQVFCPELNIKQHDKELFLNIDDSKKSNILNQVKLIYEIISYILDRKNLDINFIEQELNKINLDDFIFNRYAYLMGSNWFYPYPNNETYDFISFLKELINNTDNLINLIPSSLFSRAGREINTILSYKKMNKYSDEELDIIFNLLNIKYYDNINKLNNIYIENYLLNYYSSTHNKFIESIVN